MADIPKQETIEADPRPEPATKSLVSLVPWMLARLHAGLDDLLQDTLALVDLEVKEGALTSIGDAFFVYQRVWASVLFEMHQRLLGETLSVPAQAGVSLDVTPMHLLIARMDIPDVLDEQQIVRLAQRLLVSPADLTSWLAASDPAINGLSLSLLDSLPATLVPTNRGVRLMLLFRLLSVPPIHLLGEVYERVRRRIMDDAAALGACVGLQIVRPRIPGYRFLSDASIPLDPHFFERHSVDELTVAPALNSERARLEAIREVAAKASIEVDSDDLCPHCGEPHGTLRVPREGVQFRLLMDDPGLARTIGLHHYDEVVEHWKARSGTDLKSALDFSDVKSPLCLMLVEGESEEEALPLLALRLDIHLPSERILVFNAGGKSNVEKLFFANRANHPLLAIACLVDRDAETWANDANRAITKSNQLDRYHVELIHEGDFEDLFEREDAVDALNLLFPGTPPLAVADFPKEHRFSKVAGKVLWAQRNAQLDKRVFARAIALRVPLDRIPEQLRRFIERSRRLALAAAARNTV